MTDPPLRVAPPDSAAPSLSDGERRRGRTLAYFSHPFGMTFRTVFTAPLPTLALLSLGASESIVGLQSAFVSAAVVLQLPALWLVGRFSKRSILVGAHTFGLIGALPLLAFASLDGGVGLRIAVVCFATAAAGIGTSETVWFPLLRGFVEPERIGRFFAVLRSGWHFTLIAYFLLSRAWLAGHPGDFAPLFAVGIGCGLVRIALITRLPERNERTGVSIRIREALALLRDRSLRRYLAGVACSSAARTATLPFAVVLLRREIGLAEADVVYTAVATYAGGLISLYLWGQAVDRFGSHPVFVWTSVGMSGLVAGLLWLEGPGTGTLVAGVAFYFAYAVLSAGFGVADTHLLFALVPAAAPSRALVLASVTVGAASALTPALAGAGLERGLEGAPDRLSIYHVFFVATALLHLLALLPLREFRRRHAHLGASPS